MRRLGFVLVAAVLSTATVAGAEPSRAAANQPAKAARAKSPAKPAARTKVKPVVKAIVSDDADADEPIAKVAPANVAVKPFAIPTAALLTQYQRVGRELLLLSNDRRAQVGVEKEDAKLSCAELQATFRSIKIDDAVKTPESRAQTAALLQDLHNKIERLKGVALSQDCLNNPLAKECT